MSFVAIKSKFHVALDGVGLILQGAPDRPGYRMTNAPVYGTRFASGDRDYNDLSQWWYLTQTDWLAGIKDAEKFEDDAKFYYSSNIDNFSYQGKIKLAQSQALINTFTENLICAAQISNQLILQKYYGTDKGAGTEPKVYEETQAAPGTFTSIFEALTDSADTVVSHIFGNKNTVFALLVGTDATGTVLTRQSTTNNDVTAAIDTVVLTDCFSSRCGCSLDGVAYIFIDGNAERYSIASTATDSPSAGANWTLRLSQNDGTPVAAVPFNGYVYYLIAIKGNTILELRKFNPADNTSVSVREFKNVTIPNLYGLNNLLQVLNGKLLVTIPTEEIWEMTTAEVITRIYIKDKTKKNISAYVAVANLANGCIISEQKAFWGNLVYDGTYFSNGIKPFADSATDTVTPFFTTSTDIRYFGESVDTKKIYKVDPAASVYKTGTSNTAFLVMSQHDKIQSIDKLLNSVTIGFDALASGQSIAVYYKTTPTPESAITNWTLLGTASFALDGATPVFKVLPFSVGITAKKVWFRVELTGGGSNTPTLNDLTLEYLPMTDYKKQWSLTLNCADDLKRLDGALVETTGRELKSRIERAWWTKSQLDFEDLDYATTLANDASFDATETTITVDSTADFPEQGRIRVDDEEITYTGKTPTTFTGCTRGARGTRAATHADNSVVNNAYRVIILDVEERAPILLEDKELEYIVGLQLREV